MTDYDGKKFKPDHDLGGSAEGRAKDDLMRSKLKDHAGYWSREYKAKTPEPDWETKGAPDDDKISVSPMIKIFHKGGVVPEPLSKHGELLPGVRHFHKREK